MKSTFFVLQFGTESPVAFEICKAKLVHEKSAWEVLYVCVLPLEPL